MTIAVTLTIGDRSLSCLNVPIYKRLGKLRFVEREARWSILVNTLKWWRKTLENRHAVEPKTQFIVTHFIYFFSLLNVLTMFAVGFAWFINKFTIEEATFQTATNAPLNRTLLQTIFTIIKIEWGLYIFWKKSVRWWSDAPVPNLYQASSAVVLVQGFAILKQIYLQIWPIWTSPGFNPQGIMNQWKHFTNFTGS